VTLFKGGALALVLLLGLGLSACTGSSAAHSSEVLLATTTSTYDTGLLDVLIPRFEASTAYRVKPIAVGTGMALAMAERGEADVLLVHAPTEEKRLVESGVVTSRTLVMYNFFAIAGPPADPARIRGVASAAEAMRRIAESGSPFISRGDDSGTHKMERSLWTQAGVTPSGSWYRESGQGMGATLGIASEKSAYTLTDRGTFLALRGSLQLQLHVDGDPSLLNIYSVLQLNGESFSRINVAGGMAFARFLLSADTQAIIEQFGVDRFGEPLFVPAGGEPEENLGR
jgi:tungstate transport system substrate-binding protein